jgi:DNA replication and repair protein RecF
VLIRELVVENLRLIEELRLAPEAGINVIAGPNGAGKTSILEAIYLAGRGRTFRHHDARPLIREGETEARVLLRIQPTAGGRIMTLGMARQGQGLQCRLDGTEVRKRSVLAEALPVQWVSSQPQGFLEGGPDMRRRFLDMVVFHVEQRYLEALTGYQRALRQRNAALRAGDGAASRVWHPALSEFAVVLNRSRQQMVEQLTTAVVALTETWDLSARIEFRYHPGWSENAALRDELDSRLQDDLRQGYTGRGPHRAEIEVLAVQSSKGRPAAKVLSRGQLKMLVIAINLAAYDVIVAAHPDRRPIWLIDDLAAELDLTNRQRVMAALSERDAQAFITRLNDERLPGDRTDAVFHVERGQLI